MDVSPEAAEASDPRCTCSSTHPHSHHRKLVKISLPLSLSQCQAMISHHPNFGGRAIGGVIHGSTSRQVVVALETETWT